MYSGNGSDSAYATPLTEHMPSEASSKTKSVEQPRVPREILGVKDAEKYKVTGRTIIVALDGTGDQVGLHSFTFVLLVLTRTSSSMQITATSST